MAVILMIQIYNMPNSVRTNTYTTIILIVYSYNVQLIPKIIYYHHSIIIFAVTLWLDPRSLMDDGHNDVIIIYVGIGFSGSYAMHNIFLKLPTGKNNMCAYLGLYTKTLLRIISQVQVIIVRQRQVPSYQKTNKFRTRVWFGKTCRQLGI